MDEEVAFRLAQKIAQLELDKAVLESDLNKERRLRADLEKRLEKLEVSSANDLPSDAVASSV